MKEYIQPYNRSAHSATKEEKDYAKMIAQQAYQRLMTQFSRSSLVQMYLAEMLKDSGRELAAKEAGLDKAPSDEKKTKPTKNDNEEGESE